MWDIGLLRIAVGIVKERRYQTCSADEESEKYIHNFYNESPLEIYIEKTHDIIEVGP